VLIMKETLWKNNLNFVKDLPATYADPMRTYSSFREKMGYVSFVPTSVFCLRLQKVVVLAL